MSSGPDIAVPSITLNDEYTMPVLGLGVAELTEEETERAVSTALEIGYRLIDTAAVYGNEAAVGRAIAASGIPRAELFVTTKIANADQGFQASQDAAKVSLDRLGLDYVDLFLIHWPMAQHGKYVDTFGGLIQARGEGHTRSIGVCNFTEEHVETTIDLTYVTPAVNQIELHPLLNQAELRAVNARHNIVTEAYSPLAVGRLIDNANRHVDRRPVRPHRRTGADPVEHPTRQCGDPAVRQPRANRQQFRRLRLRADR